ncbi:MAG TPA: PspC domain-containing protein [Candidatus Dormibacteraeota bacterium]|nr:PspC domain-containing protein [Candidatus Dormibacteraeota bacterium]
MGETAGGVLRRGSDRIVAGVCSGLGHYFGIDVMLVRLAFIVLALLHGVGILLYIVLWFLMDPPATGQPEGSRHFGERLRAMIDEVNDDLRSGFRRSQRSPTGSPPTPATSAPGPRSNPPPIYGRPRGFWLGVILIVGGAYFLLDNLGFLNLFRWDIFWPVLLIAIGLFVLLRRR